MSRRAFLRDTLGATMLLLIGASSMAQDTTTKPKQSKPFRGRGVAPKNIRIRAHKFAFTPNHITIYQNEQVVLEFTSADVAHGVASPDLGIRSDILPGPPTLVTITPEQTGDFAFFCDAACGDGHDKMQGKITVVARTS